MRKRKAVSLLLLVPMAALLCSMRPGECIGRDGTFRGKRLCGRVRIVASGADFNVRVVNSFEDLGVVVKSGFASKPGEWQFVSGGGADFTVRIVEGHADFTIRFVSSFPGVRKPCKEDGGR